MFKRDHMLRVRVRALTGSKGKFLVACWALPALAHALTVDDVVIHSALGQPLRASVAIRFDSSEEQEAVDTLQAYMAPPEEYVARNLDGPRANAPTLQIQRQARPDRALVSLATDKPFIEPLSTWLIRVRLGPVSILREFDLLMDVPSTAMAAANPGIAGSPLIDEIAADIQPPAPNLVKELEKSVIADSTSSATAVVKKPVRTTRGSKPSNAFVNLRNPISTGNPDTNAPQVVNVFIATSRFKLATSLDSYRNLVVAGRTPEPATALQMTIALENFPRGEQETSSNAPIVRPISDRIAPPITAASSDSFLGTIKNSTWLTVVAFLILSTAWHKRGQWWPSVSEAIDRSYPLKGTKMGAFVRVRRIRAQRLRRRPKSLPEPRAYDLNRFDSADDQPMIHQPVAAVIDSGVTSVTSSGVRKRLVEMQRQFTGLEAQRLLKLADVYLDMQRPERARQLLNQVSHLTATSARLPVTQLALR